MSAGFSLYGMTFTILALVYGKGILTFEPFDSFVSLDFFNFVLRLLAMLH